MKLKPRFVEMLQNWANKTIATKFARISILYITDSKYFFL